MFPLKMIPDYKELIWGGNRLRTLFGKDIPSDHTGESWEIACHKNGKSVVANGPYAGQTLEAVIRQEGLSILGTQFSEKDIETFPLLVKLIDATDRLSVQVHPEDDYALAHEGDLGKTEMWYVVHADPGSRLIYGVREGVDKETFRAALADGTVGDLLNFVPVSAGDVFFMPATTLHAICEGLVIAEIQQNSDTTYRVFDWNRVGKDGKPRPLHVEKALDVTDLTPRVGHEKVAGRREAEANGNVRTRYVSCPYFATEKLEVAQAATERTDGTRFELLLFLDGSGAIECGGEAIPFQKGDCFFVPANAGAYTIKGTCALLKSDVPDKSQTAGNGIF